MNNEEIRKALEIIRKPITVNCIDYHYFDGENYNDLIRIFENCLWFVNNVEQIIETTNQLQQRINDAMDYINFLVIFNENINGKFNKTIWGEELLEILGGKE